MESDAGGLTAFAAALMGGSPQALALVERVLLIVSSVVSFLGCAFVFTTWKSFSLPNYLSRRIVASMGLAGLATAFGFALYVQLRISPQSSLLSLLIPMGSVW
jgi:hypothetical protein